MSYLVHRIDDPKIWGSYYSLVDRSNLLQSWQYGNAKAVATGWKTMRFTIADCDGKVVAIAQASYKKFSIFGGVARFNRAPLLVVDTGDCNLLMVEIIAALIKESRKRRWWLIQIAPEIYAANGADRELRNIGLKRISSPSYGSGLIKLNVNESDLKMRLKKKWRYYLKKGLSLDYQIKKLDNSKLNLDFLIKNYESLQEKNKFKGISTNLLLSMGSQIENNDKWEFSILTAYAGEVENSLGLLVSVSHGNTSTYLIGSTNNDGRGQNVNYSLLWRAIVDAREKGINWFDLGGMDATTPSGIMHFKSGLNPIEYKLIGEYRCITIPLINAFYSRK